MHDEPNLRVAVSAIGKELQSNLKPKQWAERVTKADEQARVVSSVRAGASRGLPMSKVLKTVSPNTPWPTFQYWNARVGEDSDVPWESFLDRRIPPRPETIPDVVRASAIALRSARANMECDQARSLLTAQHGAKGDISDSSLFRIWREAGLIAETEDFEEEEVEVFHGGAGLAMIAAAAAETQSFSALAVSVQEGAQQTVARQTQGEVRDELSGRDEKGRLTKEYNALNRAGVEPGKPDTRWTPDYQKRQERDLGELQVLEHGCHIISDKLLAIAATSLLTESRGFDGLSGPRGEWLGVLGGHAYMASTLDKFLAQLGLLDVEDSLWAAHASTASRVVSRWATAAGCPPWLSLILYVDATQEPHWTDKYAKSGKISRTGRIAPCLTRIAVNAGPGQPMMVETFAGSASLKTELPRVLERADDIIGKGELGRLLVMDAEMAAVGLLSTLKADPQRDFVTVLKGVAVPKNFVPTTDWQTYRDRDKIREGTLILHGDGAPDDGLHLRVVEMRREGRHSQSTYFGTSCSPDTMTTPEVPDAYLSRWPNQEALFRNARNGLGLGTTHGYSGEWIANVALDTKRAKAERGVLRATSREVEARQRYQATQKPNAATSVKQFSKSAKKELVAATRSVHEAEEALAKIESTPRLIYERDTARENVVTALRMHLFFLIEYVLREFFGGLGIELRTFIEHFVNMPVTVVTTDTTITYQIEANPRHHDRNRQMNEACNEATRRKITRGGRVISFEMVAPPELIKRKRVKVR